MPTPYCDRGPMFLEPKKATSRVALPIPTRNRTRRHRMAIVSEERTKKEGRKEGRSANQASLPSFSPLLVPLQVLLRELSSLLTRLPLLSGLKILSLFIPTSAIKGKPERRARARTQEGRALERSIPSDGQDDDDDEGSAQQCPLYGESNRGADRLAWHGPPVQRKRRSLVSCDASKRLRGPPGAWQAAIE